MRVKDIMTKKVVTVTATAKLSEVASIFKKYKVSGVPVLDKKGLLVGVITITDMLKMLKEIQYLKDMGQRVPDTIPMKETLIQEKDRATVSMKMSTPVWTAEEESDIEYVLELMCNHNMHTIPVLRDGKLIGVVGASDIVDACI